MAHRVRLFAAARQLAGRPEIGLDLPPGATVAGLKLALVAACPALADFMPNVMIAVDAEYADDLQVIPPGADLAVIPPVSGGGDG